MTLIGALLAPLSSIYFLPTMAIKLTVFVEKIPEGGRSSSESDPDIDSEPSKFTCNCMMFSNSALIKYLCMQ